MKYSLVDSVCSNGLYWICVVSKDFVKPENTLHLAQDIELGVEGGPTAPCLANESYCTLTKLLLDV